MRVASVLERESPLDYAQSIIDTVRDPMVVLDGCLCVITASRSFCQTFQVSAAETEGQVVYHLGNGQWDIPKLHELLEVILPNQASFDNFEVTHEFPDIGCRTMLLHARKLWREGNHSHRILLTIEDITERRKVEKEAKHISELYARLLMSSQDCIKLVGLDGTLLSISESGRKLLGIEDLNSVLGTCWLNFWTGEDHQAAAHAVEAARQGRFAEFEGRFESLGKSYWWHVAVSPVIQDGKPEFILAVSRDITQRKQHEEAMERIQGELERSNEDLEQFARVASHDLRAPINSMVQFSQLLERRYSDVLDAQGKTFLKHIVQGGKNASQLLTDILSYARLAQTEQHPPHPVIGKDACKQAREHLASVITESNATVTCGIPAEVKVNVELSRLTQVLQNLIGNAIHYRSENRKPEVRITAKPQGYFWQFAVSDNGPGIDHAFQKSIFEPFKRLHGYEKPGSGIGLAICKRIIERADGTIWVDSLPNHGATFHFLLPKAT